MFFESQDARLGVVVKWISVAFHSELIESISICVNGDSLRADIVATSGNAWIEIDDRHVVTTYRAPKQSFGTL